MVGGSDPFGWRNQRNPYHREGSDRAHLAREARFATRDPVVGVTGLDGKRPKGNPGDRLEFTPLAISRLKRRSTETLLMGSIALGSITDPKKAARIAPGGLFENPPAGLRTGQVGQR